MSCCRRNPTPYGFVPQSREQVELLYQQGFLSDERYQELMADLTTERKQKFGRLGIAALFGLGVFAATKLEQE
jgi:hypothetical protein